MLTTLALTVGILLLYAVCLLLIGFATLRYYHTRRRVTKDGWSMDRQETLYKWKDIITTSYLFMMGATFFVLAQLVFNN